MNKENQRVFRAKIFELLGEVPRFCDRSGIAFGAIVILGPQIQAKCLYLLEKEAAKNICAGKYVLAEMLTEVRIALMLLVAGEGGDLGGNHRRMYMDEHPKVKAVDIKTTPFFREYAEILKVEDPLELLGFIYCIEAGSLAAILKLLEKGMIVDREFAAMHKVVELEHEKTAEKIRRLLSQFPGYKRRFMDGCRLHNSCYEEALASALA